MTAASPPTGKGCAVTPAGAQIVGDNNATVTVTCVKPSTVSGTVSGLESNETVTLTLTPTGGTAENVDVTGNNSFSFATKIAFNATYTVTVTSQPGIKGCVVAPTGIQTMGEADATIAVTCQIQNNPRGVVRGLAEGETVALTLLVGIGSQEIITVTGDADTSSDDGFIFGASAGRTFRFSLAVTTAPAGKVCSVTPSGSIAFGDADYSDFLVICGKLYNVNGAVSGLAGGEAVTLTLSPTGGSDETKTITANENFAFDTEVGENFTYTVTVTAVPTGKICVVAPAGMQTMGDTDATVAVSCVFVSYNVNGSVNGLENGETITLTLTPTGGTAEPEVVSGDADTSSDDSFSFDTTLLKDATYTVDITTPPADKRCTVAPAGMQTMGDGDATITVTCVKIHKVNGSVSGLAGGETVTLALSSTGGSDETKTITANESFAFDIGLAKDDTYTVTATAAPTGKTCLVAPAGTQTMGEADANFTVSCAVASYKVEGVVNGLAENETITLTLTPTGGTAETEVVTGDADTSRDDSFAFDADIAKDATYTVDITTPPTDKRCTVAPSGMQAMGDGNATITITCVKLYKISGTVTGHIGNVVFTLSTLENMRFIQRELETVNAGTGTYSLDYKMPSGVYYQLSMDWVRSDSRQTCKFGSWADGGQGRNDTMSDSDITLNIVCQANP